MMDVCEVRCALYVVLCEVRWYDEIHDVGIRFTLLSECGGLHCIEVSRRILFLIKID